MEISRIERQIGPKYKGHVQRVVHKMENNRFVQIGETIEHGNVTFREVIEKGFNYFKRTMQSFNKNGELIKGSEFSEEITGSAANGKKVRHFGVWI